MFFSKFPNGVARSRLVRLKNQFVMFHFETFNCSEIRQHGEIERQTPSRWLRLIRNLFMNIEHPDELLEYLRQIGRLPESESVRVERLDGGVSNRTMIVRRENEPDWVIKQALSKLRVEVDWFCDPARILREAAGLRTLEQLLPPGRVPELIFVDETYHLLGMTAVPEPHKNWKQILLTGEIDDRAIGQSAGILATIHTFSARQASRFEHEFEDRSFFEALRLEPYFGFAAEQVPEARLFLEDLMQETLSRRQTLVHGDYSPKNILIHRNELILLDHEVIHWGDPSFDCGFFLAHLLSKSQHLIDQREWFLAAAASWLQCYLLAVRNEPWADRLESRIVRQTLGCLLARVRGRSQLEYLTLEKRDHQATAVVELMRDSCDSFSTLCYRFLDRVSHASD